MGAQSLGAISAIIAMNFAAIVTGRGHDVTAIARTGKDATGKLAELKPDRVLTNIALADGCVWCRRILAKILGPVAARAPVWAVSVTTWVNAQVATAQVMIPTISGRVNCHSTITGRQLRRARNALWACKAALCAGHLWPISFARVQAVRRPELTARP